MPPRSASNGRLLEHIILLVNLVELSFLHVSIPEFIKTRVRESKGGAQESHFLGCYGIATLVSVEQTGFCGPLQ